MRKPEFTTEIVKKGDVFEWEIRKDGEWVRKGICVTEEMAKKEIRTGLEVLK